MHDKDICMALAITLWYGSMFNIMKHISGVHIHPKDVSSFRIVQAKAFSGSILIGVHIHPKDVSSFRIVQG